MEGETPRRCRIELMTAAERAIREAIIEVEKLGADASLTQAVSLLASAKDKVADFVDAHAIPPSPPVLGPAGTPYSALEAAVGYHTTTSYGRSHTWSLKEQLEAAGFQTSFEMIRLISAEMERVYLCGKARGRNITLKAFIRTGPELSKALDKLPMHAGFGDDPSEIPWLRDLCHQDGASTGRRGPQEEGG